MLNLTQHPDVFCEDNEILVVIECKWRMRTIIQFPRKKLCCFLGFKIKSILSSRDSFTWRTSKKSEVSSLKILHINNIISDMSFMEIKNKNRPNTDHWGTQERIDFHSEFWPNLCSKLSKNISNRDNGSPWILCDFNLEVRLYTRLYRKSWQKQPREVFYEKRCS